MKRDKLHFVSHRIINCIPLQSPASSMCCRPWMKNKSYPRPQDDLMATSNQEARRAGKSSVIHLMFLIFSEVEILWLRGLHWTLPPGTYNPFSLVVRRHEYGDVGDIPCYIWLKRADSILGALCLDSCTLRELTVFSEVISWRNSHRWTWKRTFSGLPTWPVWKQIATVETWKACSYSK